MDSTVVALILVSALLHAGWNTLVKLKGDPLIMLASIAATATLWTLPTLAVVPFPAAEVWPYLLLSMILHTLYNLLLFAGYGVQFARMHARRHLSRVGGGLVVALLVGCGAGRRHAAAPGAFDLKSGAEQFQSYCAACHQYDGQGVGEAPPLADSPWVTGPPERLIKIVLHGVKGKMEVQGQTYEREMPGFGAILPDAQIASLLSFVRHSFGAAAQPISAADARHIREEHRERTQYWTVEELLTDSKP